MGMDSTQIISAFPGTGKTYFFNHFKRFLNILDSDSSKFKRDGFPINYVQHVKCNIGKVGIIFISSHREVRELLVKENIDFILCYPNRKLKNEYIQRYLDRKSDEKFIKLLNDNWDDWITQLKNQRNCKHYILETNQFISDIIWKIYRPG